MADDLDPIHSDEAASAHLVEAAVSLAQRWVTEAADVEADPSAERLANVLKDPHGLPFTLGFVDGVMRPESAAAAAGNLSRVAPLVPDFLPWYLKGAVKAGGAVAPILPLPTVPIARRVLREMDKAHPGTSERVQRQLARPVLYFDHEHQISLEATPVEDGWNVARAFVPPVNEAHFAAFAGALAGAKVRWLDDRLEIEREGAATALRRIDPPLGFLAPFQ